MRIALIYSPTEIVKWTVSEEYMPGMWRPCRPCGFTFWSWEWIKYRARLLWHVFIGRYDVLNWGKDSGTNNPITAYRDCLDAHFKLTTDQKDPFNWMFLWLKAYEEEYPETKASNIMDWIYRQPMSQ